MPLPKQLINLLGIVVVLAVLTLGIVVVALPLYTQSLSTDSETARVAQTNSQYAIQVQALQAAKKDLSQTEREVAGLRTQITVPDHLDDAFELAIRAASAADSAITSMTAGEIEPFVARTAVGEDGKAIPPTPAPSPEATAPPTVGASGGTGVESEASPVPHSTPPADDHRLQAPFTIAVEVPSPKAAAAFLDGLRKGPRVIAIVHSSLESSASSFELTVDALAFIRTAD